MKRLKTNKYKKIPHEEHFETLETFSTYILERDNDRKKRISLYYPRQANDFLAFYDGNSFEGKQID